MGRWAARRLRRTSATGFVLGVVWAMVPLVPVEATTSILYLHGDGVPTASLTPTAPPAIALPNYDPSRDAEPGLRLEPTQLDGLLELDPTRFQRWSADKSGVTLDGPVSVTLWSAAAGFAVDTGGSVRVGLFDCQQPESECSPIASTTYPADPWSPGGDWTEHTITLAGVEYAVPNGHHLVVKLVVGAESETPLLFAYGTAEYPARIEFSAASTNAPPVAVDDAATTAEDVPVTIDLLANDEDPDGDTLDVVALGAGAAGSVLDNGDGTVTYDPLPDWNGVDSFSYTITDGEEQASADVTVSVTAVNDPPSARAESLSIDEDTSVVVDLVGLAFDVDGDPLSIEAIAAPGAGTVIDHRDGTVSFTPPADWHGTTSFAFTISDGIASDSATITIDVAPVNDAPRPRPDSASVPEDGVVTIDLLANDGDVDGDVLTLTRVGDPAQGTIFQLDAGSIRYTPDADWSGIETFAYEVTDGALISESLVTITVISVNDAPTAGDVELSIREDTSVTFAPATAGHDVDGDDLALITFTQPANASVSLEPDGSLTIEPDPDWFGVTAFSYTVGDGIATATAIITVFVDPVDDAPRPETDVVTTSEDSSLVIEVLANDFDPDGDRLSLTGIVSGGAGPATVVGSAIRYEPPPDWNGVDTFRYAVTDGSTVVAATVEVVVTPVNDAPRARDDRVSIYEDVPTLLRIVDNDLDPDGDELTLVSVTAARLGTAAIVDGRIRYTPNSNVHGVDAFAYTLQDPAGVTATARVTVTIRPVNDAPVARPDTLTVLEDGSIDFDPLDNDGDVDGDPLALSAWTEPEHGSLEIRDGRFVYTPHPDFFGSDRFRYTVDDRHGASAPSLVSIAVAPVDDVPRLHDDSATTPAGRPVAIRVLVNDVDVDGDPLEIAAFTQGAHGTVVSGGDGTLIYSPGPDFVGTDRFAYSATDGSTVQTAQVSLTRAVDRAMLIATSLSPPLQTRVGPGPAPSPRAIDVLTDEAIETLVRLAVPAAVAGAAVGGAILVQSQNWSPRALRSARNLLKRS